MLESGRFGQLDCELRSSQAVAKTKLTPCPRSPKTLNPKTPNRRPKLLPSNSLKTRETLKREGFRPQTPEILKKTHLPLPLCEAQQKSAPQRFSSTRRVLETLRDFRHYMGTSRPLKPL